MKTIIAVVMLSVGIAAQANQVESEPQVAPVPISPNLANGPKFNAAHPSAWMKWVDPKTHISMHVQFTNPTTYMQFMQPGFYMEFMKPENMMAWFNPASYQVMADPQTMNYWMNPNNYMHGMNPAMYQAAFDPANYMAFMNPANYFGLSGFGSGSGCRQDQGAASPSWFGTCNY